MQGISFFAEVFSNFSLNLLGKALVDILPQIRLGMGIARIKTRGTNTREMSFRKHEPYNALVITPESSRRAHLKMAIHHDQLMGGNTFASVHAASSLPEALAKLQGELSYEIVLISDSYKRDDVAEFVSALHQSCPQKFGIVYVLRCALQERTEIADLLLVGVDSCLCEPFSVETLREITELAAQVRKENAERKIISAAGLIVEAALDEIDRRSDQLRLGGRVGPFSHKIMEASQMFRDLSGDKRDAFFMILADCAEKRRPFEGSKEPEGGARSARGQTVYAGASEILKRRFDAKKKKKGA